MVDQADQPAVARLEALRHADAERAALAVEAAEVGVWDWDIAADRLVWDDRMFELYGLDRSTQPRVQILREMLHPEDQDSFQEALRVALASRVKFESAFRIRRSDGEVRYLRNLGKILRGPDGAAARMVGVTWDMAELRTLQATLQAREAHLRAIIDNAQQAIVTVDDDDLIIGWNRHARQIFGWSAAEALGRRLVDLTVPEELRADYAAKLAAFRAGDRSATLDQRVEAPALRKGGERFPVEVSVSAAHGPDGWERTALMQDISERKAQTELFENAFHHAPIGMALVGLDGRFLKINAAFCELLGHSEQRMLELDFQSITHPDDLQADLSAIDQLLAGEIPSYQMDKRYLRADGVQLWVRLSVSLVLEPDGRPKHFISQVQDLTARREAESRYRLMADNVRDVIITTDLTGKTTFVTPSCRPVLGVEPGNLIGRNPAERAHPDDVPNMVRVLGNVAHGLPGEAFRWRLKREQGDGWIWLESNPTLLRAEAAGERAQLLDVVRDVTAQVEQEQALEAATAAATSAAAAKTEFLANMSHEIRTPLTAILGFSGLLAGNPSLDEAARGCVERVTSAGEALLSIVNDVLDFSKLEAGQFEIKRRAVCAVDLARETLLMFAPQATAKGVELDFVAEGVIPQWLELDPDRLRQILINLVGNALKFTEAGCVGLRLRHEPATDQLFVAVEDTGPGIAEHLQANLFQRFSQIDASSTRRHGGTGLGLAICKGLTEAMGGQIAVSSMIGRGSTFSFYFLAPVAKAPVAGAPLARASRSLEGVRVLVVDDNRINRELARVVLEQACAEVSEATGGEEAMIVVATTPYDLILLDIRMPGLDGPATLKLIRAKAGPNQRAPVLAFSADAELQHFVGVDGFDDIVRKPIDATAFLATIARWTQQDAAAAAPGAAHAGGG